jgi:hypothetical protein
VCTLSAHPRSFGIYPSGSSLGIRTALKIKSSEINKLQTETVGFQHLSLQQLEGILIMPLVQQSTVHLPPVFTLFAIVAFGILLGPLGLIFATPLAVVCFVLVKKLWIRDTLEEKTAIPGEEEAKQPKP